MIISLKNRKILIFSLKTSNIQELKNASTSTNQSEGRVLGRVQPTDRNFPSEIMLIRRNSVQSNIFIFFSLFIPPILQTMLIFVINFPHIMITIFESNFTDHEKVIKS